MKQGMMLTTLCCFLGACASEQARIRTFVMTAQAPLTTLPNASTFPELEAVIGRSGPNLARRLGYKGYDVTAVVPQSSQWRYVRDDRLHVVVRRETPLGIAVRKRSASDRCLYLEPTVVQDRLGAEDWGPLRLGAHSYQVRRLDCDLSGASLASR